MKLRTIIVALTLVVAGVAEAKTVKDSVGVQADSAMARAVALYMQALDSLASARKLVEANLESKASSTKLNPYFYRVMAPGTYYNNSLHQMMGIDWAPESNGDGGFTSWYDAALNANAATNRALTQMYVNNPSLVKRTEAALKETAAIRKDVHAAPENVTTKLAEKAVTVDLEADVPEAVTVVAKKPNFWKFSGSTSLQFTQSYFSDNWYQGGENNYAGLGILTLVANFDNKQKVQWDNKLEVQLGFQTAMSDTYHKFRVTSNLLRLTSKLGYKAAKNWFYTGQVMSYTQLYPNYDKNSDRVNADFTSPLYLNVSVGIDYKLKKKKQELSIYISPVAYNMCWVDRQWGGLRQKYGMEQRSDGTWRATYHKYGPSVTVNYRLAIMKNVSWSSRLYCFANVFDNKKDMYVLVEWENTFDFTINKYLSAKFFAYPRFDNSTRDKNNPKSAHHFFMFKEWLSLGLSYRF